MMTTLSPQDRVILLSGANRGIGRAIAERLYDDGYTLSLGVRNLSSVQSMIESWDTGKVQVCHFDARDKQSADDWVSAACERFQHIDAIVNCAGILHAFDIDGDQDESLLDEMWEVNVKGPLRLTRVAFPYLKQSGHGRVVNIVSLSGKRVKSGQIAGYAMTKHAATALTHATRQSGWKYGIRTTAICPGYVATDMTADADFPREDMIGTEDIAQIVSTVLALPNTASVAEVPVNCILESFY
jgi:NAD(P)-dependent dehydrogenase (short-subunit alcohol dehydrogenase family)